MSMNLACEEMDLWQTPTHITYMCYSNNNGGWLGIRYRYIEWVKSHMNGAYDSVEAADEVKDSVFDHIEEVYKHKKLTFFII